MSSQVQSSPAKASKYCVGVAIGFLRETAIRYGFDFDCAVGSEVV